MKWAIPSATLTSLLLTLACTSGDGGSGLDINYEKYQLDNGLDVILHVDRSDPVAAVAMTFHVGSAREVTGRTGFAHLFEHLFFLDSENLGPGGLDKLMTRIGSSTNGSTNNDRTNYFEVVPSDALEKALWAEADKLGFFINTVTESVVAKEKQVVKNEKRQGVDNNPYGHTGFVISKALYPEGHPYSWQVIGSLADLDAASLSDVQDFHGKWYGPNNATLVVAGDIDIAQTKEWIEKYFGDIPERPTPETVKPQPVTLASSVRLFHEDNFARLPELRIIWPTVPIYHEDSYALSILADLLTNGKKTPFYVVIVEEEKLAPSPTAFSSHRELAGEFSLRIRTYAGVDLDSALAGVEKAFARFEEGIAPEELERVKARYETQFYGRISSVLGKAFRLAQYNIFAPTPGYAREDLERSLAVTDADVMRVYETYIKDRPHVATSFVPRGQTELALEGSEEADVVIEPIVQGAEAEFVVRRGMEKTPAVGTLDRSIEPPFGDPPALTVPQVDRDVLANGLQVLVIEDREIPLVQFEIRLRGGHLLDDPAKPGVANLLAQTMTEGTASKTPDELEQAIDLLGASINVSSGSQSFMIRGSTLARNYAATMELVEEILLEPRWDEERFELVRQRVRNTLRQRSASPNALASDIFQKLVYDDHILAQSPIGDMAVIDEITIEDLQAYYERALVPGVAAFHAAGAVTLGDVTASLAGIAERWQGGEVSFPEAPEWNTSRAGLYFLDVPNAAQSRLMIGRLALAESDPDFYPATVMNFRLGGGGFASDLTQVLREGKGYTYGIGSRFSGTEFPGPFSISSGVRSNITLEALELIKDIVERHGAEYDEEDLAATKSFLIKANARAFETLGAKLGMLADMSAYGFPADYVIQREAIVQNMTIERIQELADRYLDTSDMVWLVVGDGRTQRARLRSLGLGNPIAISREGERVR
ncbi:MAG: insulinase family protein [Gemmatimonadota bacterium]|nr:MAG: insulinase family protein [Gemmatimonadota bacterium]